MTCEHPESPLVRLWDGRDHCRACVEEACPGLAEFATGREALEDTIPFDLEGGLRVWGTYAGLFFGVLALAGVGVATVLDRAGALWLIGAMAGVLGFAMLAGLPAVYNAKWVLPTVRVRDGVVEVFRPDGTRGPKCVATFALGDARWHLGRLREDTCALGRGGAIVPDRSAVILRTPRKWPKVAPSNEFTATGSSPEMIRVWRGFLRLAGVPQGK